MPLTVPTVGPSRWVGAAPLVGYCVFGGMPLDTRMQALILVFERCRGRLLAYATVLLAAPLRRRDDDTRRACLPIRFARSV